MYIFITATCMYMYVYSVDSLKFVIKEFSRQPDPRGGRGGGTARWDI